jgi:hypothetical protein
MAFLFSNINPLVDAILALPSCPIEAHVMLITDFHERITNYIVICDHLNEIIKMCTASDPAIGQPLTDLTSQYEVQLASAQAKLDSYITLATLLPPDLTSTTLSVCGRCGHFSHATPDCSARFHKDHYELISKPNKHREGAKLLKAKVPTYTTRAQLDAGMAFYNAPPTTELQILSEPDPVLRRQHYLDHHKYTQHLLQCCMQADPAIPDVDRLKVAYAQLARSHFSKCQPVPLQGLMPPAAPSAAPTTGDAIYTPKRPRSGGQQALFQPESKSSRKDSQPQMSLPDPSGPSKVKTACQRCGHASHATKDCYARRHKRHYKLTSPLNHRQPSGHPTDEIVFDPSMTTSYHPEFNGQVENTYAPASSIVDLYYSDSDDLYSDLCSDDDMPGLRDTLDPAAYATRPASPPSTITYEISTLDHLAHAIMDQQCPTASYVASIVDLSQRREQLMLVFYYCNDVIKLCQAADPAIGRSLIDLINCHETKLLSTEQCLKEAEAKLLYQIRYCQ